MKHLLSCLAACLLLSACGKSEDSSSDSSDGGGGSNGSSASGGTEATKPWDDPAKPYLSDKTMGDFIGSLSDKEGPFDTISKGKVTAFNAGERMDAFDAAARKHGFANGEEYLGAWLRINAVNTELMLSSQNESLVKMQEESIKNSREVLKNPNATAEQKQMCEEQIKAAEESIKAMNQPREGGMNAQDVATFKKHKAAFEEAMKKWTK